MVHFLILTLNSSSICFISLPLLVLFLYVPEILLYFRQILLSSTIYKRQQLVQKYRAHLLLSWKAHTRQPNERLIDIVSYSSFLFLGSALYANQSSTLNHVLDTLPYSPSSG